MVKRRKNFSFHISLLLIFLGLSGLFFLIASLLKGYDVVLFNPKGLIAHEEYRLMMISTLIMLGFAAPVLFMLYFFAWKYREGNQRAEYRASSNHRKSSVFTIWALPTLIMLILAALMLPATQKLEPQKLIESDKKPLKIQVVALRWKWLFIYPEQNIATVNYVQIPVDTPVQFELTADETPMSSFWIPHLGGMLYAMTEHVNRLNLMADTIGDYEGSAAEINGAGFAGMRFTTRVSSEEDFYRWAFGNSLSKVSLNTVEYEKLLVPSENHPATYYSSPDKDLYSTIVSKYGESHHSSAEGHTGH
jgi:cytochrome o ubiquinol oxidase subunit II